MVGTTESAQYQYLEYIDRLRVPLPENVIVERHRPEKFASPYHHHASIEVNFLTGCEMDYSFSGTSVTASAERMTVFWGAVPHRVADVRGQGEIVNIYVTFSQMLGWGLPDLFVDSLIGGEVVCSASVDPIDRMTFPRWADEFARHDPAWRKLLIGEIEMRLRRMALEGWTTLKRGHGYKREHVGGAVTMRYIEEMLRFISDNFASSITVADVTKHVRLSQSYAMTLFRRVVGVPIKEHITRTRLSHAQMLLSSSEMKIVNIAIDSGFRSLSSFYEAFQARSNLTPAAFRRVSHH